jgi:hypothetical protein
MIYVRFSKKECFLWYDINLYLKGLAARFLIDYSFKENLKGSDNGVYRSESLSIIQNSV